ncbi:hypothetical protein SAMN05216548_11082 [Faunimonas pinastri]|uniref:Antitoxin-like ribbon-helix-helix domain-containing protein n=1 Tax=Faunimonas pinastri TaxID=1855383 RepID=A0A1H9KTQ6_9HYPH|nr:ribbon-helix-helix domain-containing protein [Faunimonas pinastri]SER02448.1 hypothetical protein SAMN05216548_11082 [Faunimonas pinastri]
MPKPLKPNLKSIVAASQPIPLHGESSVVRLQTATEAAPQDKAKTTLKQRAKQLSVYLEPPVYDQLRDLAYTERSKIHTLMLEALDMLFTQRGVPSIRELEKRG